MKNDRVAVSAKTEIDALWVNDEPDLQRIFIDKDDPAALRVEALPGRCLRLRALKSSGGGADGVELLMTAEQGRVLAERLDAYLRSIDELPAITLRLPGDTPKGTFNE